MCSGVWRCVVVCGGGVVVFGGLWRWYSGVWWCVVVCGGGVEVCELIDFFLYLV